MKTSADFKRDYKESLDWSLKINAISNQLRDFTPYEEEDWDFLGEIESKYYDFVNRMDEVQDKHTMRIVEIDDKL